MWKQDTENCSVCTTQKHIRLQRWRFFTKSKFSLFFSQKVPKGKYQKGFSKGIFSQKVPKGIFPKESTKRKVPKGIFLKEKYQKGFFQRKVPKGNLL
jgi:hypothetical protein